jgi:hypothetical protein
MPEALRERERERREPAEAKPRRNLFPFVVGGGALLAVIAGFLIGGSGGDDGTATGPPTVPAQNAAMSLKVPTGWARQPTAPQVPGIDLSEAVAFAPSGGVGSGVVFGTADDSAANSTLLPASLLEGLSEQPEGEAVELGPGKLQALRYRDLQPEGAAQPFTVFAAPTSAGVATIACLPPASPPADFGDTCEAIANTAALKGGEGFAIGPSKTYADAVNGALGDLDKAVKTGRSALGANTPKRQAAAAAAVQGAYSKAAKSLGGLELSPADQLANAQLVAALDTTAKAWGKAASAARNNNKGGFRSAGADISKGEKAVAERLAKLEEAGYDVTS